MYKKLNFCSKLIKKHNLRRLKPFQVIKYRFSSKENLGATNDYIFIKPHTTIRDLTYKEEILEYFAYNYSNLLQGDLLIIVLKLRNFKVLASEIKDIKCFFRDFLEISEKINDENLKYEFIELFLEKMNEINKNIKENSINVEMENNFFDLDFSNILNSFMVFIQRTIPVCKTQKLFEVIFKSLNAFTYEDKSISNEIWIKLIESFYINEEIHLNKTDLISTCSNLRFSIKAFSEGRIQDIKKIRYLMNNFNVKFSDWIESDSGNMFKNISEENKLELRVLYYYLNENLCKFSDLNDSLTREFKILSNELMKTMFLNDEEAKRFLVTYKTQLDEDLKMRNEENHFDKYLFEQLY